MLARTPPKWKHKSSPRLRIHYNQSIQREFTSSKGMQQSQPHKVIIIRSNSLYKGKRYLGRRGGNVRRRVAAENEGL